MAGPHAEIVQIGRMTWRVSIHDGCLIYGPDRYGWRVWGRQRAGRKARRELGRYLEREERGAASVIIR